MAISFKHTKVSAKADGPDSSLIQPSDWNAEHTLSMAANFILGRTTAGAGPVQEISVGTGLTLSGGSLSVTPGVYQPIDAELSAIAALVSAADKLAYFTGSGAAALTTLTSLARTLLDDTTPQEMRDTLGITAVPTSVGKHTIWVPAGAWYESPPKSYIWPDFGHEVIPFDASVYESASFQIRMPKSWNKGALELQFVWSHPSTTTNFGVQFECYAASWNNNIALTADDWNAWVTVNDTGGATNTLYISPTLTITPETVVGDEDLVNFYIGRNVSDPADTLAVDCYLHGVTVKYTTNAATDD